MGILRDYYNTGQSDYNGVDSASWFLQGVTPSRSYTLKRIKVMLFKAGTITGNTTFYLYASSSNHPTGSVLSSGTIDNTTITATSAGTWYDVIMSDFSMVAGTQYVLVAKNPDNTTPNYTAWCDQGTGASYAGGFMAYSANGGSSWTDYAGADMMFEMYDNAVDYYDTNDDNTTGEISSQGNKQVGQRFTTTKNYIIKSADIKLYRTGAAGNITFGVYATSSGLPTGSALCSGVLDCSAITTDTGGVWYSVSFGTGAQLTSGTAYALVATATGSDTTNWRGDWTSPTYSGGAYLYNDSSWGVDNNADLMFETFGTVGTNGVNYEQSGYEVTQTGTTTRTVTGISLLSSGTNNCLFVSVGCSTNDNITGVSWNGDAMTQITTQNKVGNSPFQALYYLVNPDLGSRNLTVTVSSSQDVWPMFHLYSGANQTPAYSGSATDGYASKAVASGSSAVMDIEVTTVSDNSWVMAFTTTNYWKVIAGANTTARYEGGANNGLPNTFDSNSPKTPAGAVTLNFTSHSDINCNITACSVSPYVAITTDIKSVGGLAIASVKSYDGLAIASVKSINGLE